MGGVGALASTLLDQPGRGEPCQGKAEELVDAVVLGRTVTKVAQHAAVKARIIQLQPQGILKSRRQRTASAACRWDREQETAARRRWPAVRARAAARLSRRYQATKSSSRRSTSSRSRTHIALVPCGLLARAPRGHRGNLRSGTGTYGHRHLDGISAGRNTPSVPGDHAAPPRNLKIPDTVAQCADPPEPLAWVRSFAVKRPTNWTRAPRDAPGTSGVSLDDWPLLTYSK